MFCSTVADTHTWETTDKIIREVPGKDRIQDCGFTNMLIISVFAMLLAGLERPVLQAFRNSKRMFSTIVVLKRLQAQ